jgi:hypothetical protein
MTDQQYYWLATRNSTADDVVRGIAVVPAPDFLSPSPTSNWTREQFVDAALAAGRIEPCIVTGGVMTAHQWPGYRVKGETQ